MAASTSNTRGKKISVDGDKRFSPSTTTDGATWRNVVKIRCSIRWYLSSIEQISPKDIHYRRMSKTPFLRPLNIPEIDVNAYLLDELLGRYLGANKFDIGGIPLEFSSFECAACLGLPCSGYCIKLTGRVKKIGWLEEKLFGSEGGVDLSRDFLTRKMKSMVDLENEDDVEIFCSLWILLMCSSFLLCTASYTCPRHVIAYLAHLDDAKYYNWGDAVHHFLMDKLDDVSISIKKRNEDRVDQSVGYVIGCAVALLVWCYEHTTISTPTFFNTSIRLQKWASRGKEDRRVRAIATLQSDEVIGEVEWSKQEKKFVYPMMHDVPSFNQLLRRMDIPSACKVSSRITAGSSSVDEENKRLRVRIEELENLLKKKDDGEGTCQDRGKPENAELSEDIVYHTSSCNYCTATQLEEARKGGFVVDDVIDAYLDILATENQNMRTRHKCGFLSIYAQNKFRGDPSLTSHEEVLEFGKFFYRENMKNLSLYFMIIFSDAHWHLVVIDMKEKCFKMYNSRTGHHRDKKAALLLVGWAKRYMAEVLALTEVLQWKTTRVDDIPRQDDGSLDCAIFTMQYVEHLARRKKMAFKQIDMPTLRENFICKIYNEGQN